MGSRSTIYADGPEDLEAIGKGFKLFAEIECGSQPLYRAICLGASADPTALSLLNTAPKGQKRPVLFLAAIHYLLLEDGHGRELAKFYPSLSGSYSEDDYASGRDPYPAVAAFIDERRDELEAIISTRGTQTNEVNRSCAWFVGMRHIASMVQQPLFLIEFGASAGLNLGFDRYRYDFVSPNADITTTGVEDSPVVLECELWGSRVPPIEESDPVIAGRVGIDIGPISVYDESEIRWLRACLWPEQTRRFERFDAALSVTASAGDFEILAGDGIEMLDAALALAPKDSHIVLFHSWALTYVERSRRTKIVDRLAELSKGTTVSWLSAEAPGCVPGVPTISDSADADFNTVLALTQFNDVERTDQILAGCHPHLAWMEWLL